MPSKNDLSALKKPETKPILPSNERAGDKRAPLTGKSKGGRPPATEKRSHKVLLSLTEKEGAMLAEKAGLAAGATVIYAHLKETGFFD